MAELVAYCGIVCTECPAFIATQTNDDAKKKEVAEQWAKQYNMPIKPEDIHCDGCVTKDGRHIGYCNICEIRKCGIQKAVMNCAYCDDYGCEKLTKFWAMAPHGKKTADKIKKSRR
jgi:hypothetical protein